MFINEVIIQTFLHMWIKKQFSEEITVPEGEAMKRIIESI